MIVIGVDFHPEFQQLASTYFGGYRHGEFHGKVISAS